MEIILRVTYILYKYWNSGDNQTKDRTRQYCYNKFTFLTSWSYMTSVWGDCVTSASIGNHVMPLHALFNRDETVGFHISDEFLEYRNV